MLKCGKVRCALQNLAGDPDQIRRGGGATNVPETCREAGAVTMRSGLSQENLHL